MTDHPLDVTLHATNGLDPSHPEAKGLEVELRIPPTHSADAWEKVNEVLRELLDLQNEAWGRR